MKTNQIINKFDKYLKETIGATKNTRRHYLRYVQEFLREKFSDVMDDLVMAEIFKAAKKHLRQNLPNNEYEKQSSRSKKNYR